MPVSALRRQARRLLREGLQNRPGEAALADDSHEVSEAEYRNQVDNEGQGGRAFQDASGDASKRRLWDVVDQNWTEPLRIERHNYYLRKVVAVCSGCSEMSTWERDILAHIQRVRVDAELHRTGAKIQYSIDGGKSVAQCTGCGKTFISRPEKAGSHIESMLAALASHKKASPQTILRFRIQPEPLAIEKSPPIASNGASDEPIPGASTDERTPRKRKRKRKRGKKLEANSG